MQADDSKKMEGMVAIVTGGSRGLGRAIAKEFAAEGAKVVVSARRSSPTGLPGTAVETAEQIREAGGEAMALTCDVSDEKQVVAMVNQTIDMYGQIDVLVNNAGVMVLGETLLDIDPEKWDQSVAANLRGPYLCSRSVLPWMTNRAGAASSTWDRAWATTTRRGAECSTAPPRLRCTCLASAWPTKSESTTSP